MNKRGTGKNAIGGMFLVGFVLLFCNAFNKCLVKNGNLWDTNFALNCLTTLNFWLKIVISIILLLIGIYLSFKD